MQPSRMFSDSCKAGKSARLPASLIAENNVEKVVENVQWTHSRKKM